MVTISKVINKDLTFVFHTHNEKIDKMYNELVEKVGKEEADKAVTDRWSNIILTGDPRTKLPSVMNGVLNIDVYINKDEKGEHFEYHYAIAHTSSYD